MSYFTLILLFVASYLFKEGSSQSHAFIQVDNELKYLVDGVPVPMNEVLNSDGEQGFENIYDDRIISKNYLIFDPPFLDFKEHPTGMPLMKKVYVQNTSPDTSIHLHSLSGNTMHFHCTFFQDKVITPGGNTTFDVVFLGREEGFIENTIYVHTSVGTYRYWVKAVGTSNPYRVRPLIGVRMPLNSSYTPMLQVHNPHSENLQIMEMYSTGGDLHLELSESVQDAEGKHWSILPFHTKTIMRATFVARRENNHTAYIRIVPKDPVSDYMVIPIEVEVSSEQGLFFPSDTLHFGLLTPHDPPVSVPLYLLNSAPKHIYIQNIITSTVNEAITIDFKPVKIPPGTVHPTQVATVTFDPSKVTSGIKVSGKLLVKSKISAYKLSIPFSVDLHRGSLLYNSSVTRFFSGSDMNQNSTVETVAPSMATLETSILGTSSISAARTSLTPVAPPPIIRGSTLDNDPHDLILKNTFRFPVVVHNITVPDSALPHFKVNWEGPIIIKQDGSAKVAELTLLSAGSDLRFTVNITIHTNITSISIPLIAYNGKLTKYVPPSGSENWLDFGTLGMGEQHDNYFYILNENPVEIRLKGWGSTLSHSAVELMGIVEGNFSDISRNPNKTFPSKSLFLKPNHYAVFRIGILTPNSEGIFIAESFVQTQYEVIKLPFRLRTADGLLSIFPDTILMEENFPGKISEQEVYILSTFGHSMTVEGINPQSLDPRFTYVTPESCGPQPILQPDHQSHIGKIVFDPNSDCEEECYTGLPLHSKAGQQWTATFPLTSHAADVDISLVTSLHQRFEKLPSRSFNVSLLLDTSEVRGYKFNAKVDMIWPRFVSKSEVEFPLTQVRNTTYSDFTVYNPASQPVIAQMLFLHHYPTPQAIIPMLQEQLRSQKNLSWEDNPDGLSEVFTFVDLDQGINCNSWSGSGSGEGSLPQSPHSTSSSSSSASPPSGQSASGNLSSVFACNRRSFESQFKTRVAKDSLPLYMEPRSQTKIRVSFTPLDERRYSAVILLRNNLTVVEAILVQGVGGRGHINFKKTLSKSPSYFHFSIQEKNLKNCSFSSSASQSGGESPPMYTLRQTFLAENDGELPVELYDFHIGDTPCQSYGFRVVNCSSFMLQPNESHRIEVAFTPDFSLYHVEQFLVIRTSLTGVTPPLSRRRENVTLDPNGNLLLRLVATVSTHAVAKCSDKIPRPVWEPLLYYSVVTILVAMFLGTIVRAILEAEHTLKTNFVAMTTVVPLDQPIPTFDRGKVFDLQAIGARESEVTLQDEELIPNSAKSSPPQVKVKHSVNAVDQPRKHNISSSSSNSSSLNVFPVTNAKSSYNSNNNTNYNNNNNNNNVSYNTNKSKVSKMGSNSSNSSGYASSDRLSELGRSPHSPTAPSPPSPPQAPCRRSSDQSKHEAKMSLASFFSLPFGLNKKQGGVVSGQFAAASSAANWKQRPNNKQRKTSHKERINSFSSDSKEPHEEDFSSTTTEGSSVDDICLYLRDINSRSSEDKPAKRNKSAKSSYSGSSRESVFPVKTSLVDRKDTGFEITTKCKGIKKIKETTSSKKHANTLELPYTLKPTKVQDLDQDEKKINMKIKNKNTPSVEKIQLKSSQGKREEVVRPPDPVTAIKRAPAKAIIAPSARPVPHNQPLAPRDPSYSSIVLGNTKQKAKVTPVGKILPEVKRVETKPLGVIGQKVPPSTSSSVFHQPLKAPPPIGSIPPSSPPPFSPQDSLHSHPHGLYMSPLTPPSSHMAPPQAVSSHSWDPKTLSSPSNASVPLVGALDHLRNPAPMSDDDWLPFGGTGFPSVWGDADGALREKQAPINPPSPSLWESLSSFSIWSSPWNNDQSPLGGSSSLMGNGGSSLWGASQTNNPFDIGTRLPPIGNLDMNLSRSKDKENDPNPNM